MLSVSGIIGSYRAPLIWPEVRRPAWAAVDGASWLGEPPLPRGARRPAARNRLSNRANQ